MNELAVPRPVPSQRGYARFAGLMYFVVLGFDIAGLVLTSAIAGDGSFLEASHRIIASETLYRIGLCFGLIGGLATIPLAIGLYAAVKPVDPNLALTALLFRAAEAATGATGIILGFGLLQLHLAVDHVSAFDANQLGALADVASGAGTEVAAIFFSVGSTIFFYLLLKSGYIPRLLSGWGVFASLAYLSVWFVSLTLPHNSGTAVVVGSLPILIAELSTGLWLLIRGIK